MILRAMAWVELGSLSGALRDRNEIAATQTQAEVSKGFMDTRRNATICCFSPLIVIVVPICGHHQFSTDSRLGGQSGCDDSMGPGSDYQGHSLPVQGSFGVFCYNSSKLVLFMQLPFLFSYFSLLHFSQLSFLLAHATR